MPCQTVTVITAQEFGESRAEIVWKSVLERQRKQHVPRAEEKNPRFMAVVEPLSSSRCIERLEPLVVLNDSRRRSRATRIEKQHFCTAFRLPRAAEQSVVTSLALSACHAAPL